MRSSTGTVHRSHPERIGGTLPHHGSEVIAVLRVLETFRPILSTSPFPNQGVHQVLRVKLAVKVQLQGRSVSQLLLALMSWSLDIYKMNRGEDGLAAIMDARITPRERLDTVAEHLSLLRGASRLHLLFVWNCWRPITKDEA